MDEFNTSYQLGDCVFHPHLNTLSKQHQKISLEPKTSGVLLQLIKQYPNIVTVDDLNKNVWPETIVSNQSVQRNISILRKALGKTESTTGYIKTISKRGYMLVVPPTRLEATPLKPALNIFSLIKPHMIWLLSILSLILVAFLLISFSSKNSNEISDASASDVVYLNAQHPTCIASVNLNSNNLSLILKNWRNEKTATYLLSNNHYFGREFQLVWSPNFNRLVVGWFDNQSRLQMFNIDTACDKINLDSNLLADDTYRYDTLAWLDENKLIVSRTLHGELFYQLDQLDVKNGKITPYIESKHQIRHFAVNSKYLSFVIKDNKQFLIQVLDKKSHKPITTFASLQPAVSMQWRNEDDLWVLHQDNAIYRYSLNGQKQKLRHSLPYNSQPVHISYNQTRQALLILSHQKNQQIEIVNIKQQKQSQVAPNYGDQTDASLSNEQGKIAFVSNANGHNQVFLLDKKLTPKQLTYFNSALNISHLSWSNDDSKLLFKADDSVYLYQINNAHLTKLITANLLKKPLGFINDATTFVYADDNTERTRFWQQSLINGDKKLLDIPFDSQLVFNAEHLFYHPRNSSSLYSIQAGRADEIESDFPTKATLIDADDQCIYYKKNIHAHMRSIYCYQLTQKTHHLVLDRLKYIGEVLAIKRTKAVILNTQLQQSNITMISLEH
ncbi:winged helix-turn-helix domain-containing protein [Catenovulum adriaticum]|uniref:Winged helix-turn-helix domain-containing protein n=1 Tax=Catenovulum adriaticum TaxID=2984846 RepID=A0ABY7AU28_9ALTE|nr:winged helix-turn-helix domain-containing protein [Catenovulum sp. TS8]WAJ71771.1 winged helix-turn-helix domain-containing protein [Catenovulum sp. TS8]